MMPSFPLKNLLDKAPTVTAFTVDVSHSFEGANVSREEWDELVLNVRGDLYVSYDWCRIWWHHYGAKRRLHLYIFRDGGRLVGLAPIFVERLRLGLINLKIAKRVGADFALTIFALPISPDYVELAYEQLLIRLMEGEKCDAVSFGFMPGDDPTLAGLRHTCASLGRLLAVVRDMPAGPHTTFDLPDTFEKYLSALNSRQRQNYRRRLKLLKENFAFESDVVSNASRAEITFNEFKALHERQWNAEGKLGHFGDWPRAAQFNADLVRELSPLGRCRITRLFADQRVIGYQYCFVFGDTCYWRLPARAPERELDRFGLGILGMVQLFETMIKEGIRRIEAGVGHYDYKVQFGGEELEFRSFFVTANRPFAIFCAHLFLRLSDVLHFVYYRAWYLRVAPRLQLPGRSLWEIWIRFRV